MITTLEVKKSRMELHETYIAIHHEGWLNKHAMKGVTERRIRLRQVTSLYVQKPGFTSGFFGNGYLQVQHTGNSQQSPRKGDVAQAGDLDALIFVKKDLPKVEAFVEAVYAQMDKIGA